MARDATVDFGDLGLTQRQDQDVRAMLHGWQQQRQRLETAQLQNAARQNRYRRTLTGEIGGEVTMSITPTMYHQFGNHYGYGCWSDDDFCRQVIKHYPETRVESRSVKATIIRPDGAHGVARPTEHTPRFTKTYPGPKTKNTTNS